MGGWALVWPFAPRWAPRLTLDERTQTLMSVIPWPWIPCAAAAAAAPGAQHAMIEHMPSADDTAGLAAALIQSRQTILPKRLGAG